MNPQQQQPGPGGLVELIDAQGCLCTFDLEHLRAQLIQAELLGTGIMRAAFRQFLQKVSDCRRQQKDYFRSRAAQRGDALAILAMAKRAEQTVDESLKYFHLNLENLPEN